MTKEEKEALLKAVSNIEVTKNNPDSPVFESREITSEISSKIYEVKWKAGNTVFGTVFSEQIDDEKNHVHRIKIDFNSRHCNDAHAEIRSFGKPFDEQKILQIATLIYQLLDEQTEGEES